MPTQGGAWWRPAGWSRSQRRAAGALAALAVMVAVAVTSYRTLRPAENLNRAKAPLPAAVPALPLPYGELSSAPLIVDSRLRVYAEERRVWADAPVTAIRPTTPHWAYRRWPAQLVGVLTLERTFLWGRPSLAITKWSDGSVVALDATSGEVVWQASITPDPDETFHGRYTGAQTAYRPDGLFTAVSGVDGRLMLLVPGKDQVHAYDPWTGTEIWTHLFAVHPGCHRDDWTGQTTYVVKDSCATPAVLEIFDAATGFPLGTWRPPGASAGPGKEANWYVRPTGCLLGRSRCQLIKAAATAEVISFAEAASGVPGVVPGTWALSVTGSITPEPGVSPLTGVDSDSPMVTGDIRVEQMLNGYVWAHSRTTGALLWISQLPGALVAVDGTTAYAVGRDLTLLGFSASTGVLANSIDTHVRGSAGGGWRPGYAYVHDGFAVIERVVGKESDDDKHYYANGKVPVLLVGV